jgi:hypothetical protein
MIDQTTAKPSPIDEDLRYPMRVAKRNDPIFELVERKIAERLRRDRSCVHSFSREGAALITDEPRNVNADN